MTLRLSSVDALPLPLREQAMAQLRGARQALICESRAKYGNQAYVDIEGTRFDSKLEWRCCEWLKARALNGEILWFTRQVPFTLEGGVVYRADFLAALAAGGVEVIDAKGHDTRAAKNKRKQVRARYGVTVQLWPQR
ncbi:MAG TPA: DUF1064 domain-containing protein [Steroidobacteraceae bacterium]|jgi:hypothetical protein